MLDFPSNPISGQQYDAPNGVTYEFAAPPGMWTASGTWRVPTPVTNMYVHVSQFGAVGNGTTDDRVAIQNAIDYVASRGGGTVDCAGGRWLIDSGDLIMKSNVFLVGPWLMAGYATVQKNYTTTKSTIVLNPAFTIRFDDYNTFYLPFNSGLQGLIILKKGMGYPTTFRAAYELVKTFEGTAITNIQATDVWLSNLLIIGFNWGIWFSGAQRSRIQYINGDNVNGIHIDNSADIQHMSNCHMWSFSGAHIGFPTNYKVVSVTNAGGKIRLTVDPVDSVGGPSGGKPNVLQTGDRVTVANPIGSNARAAWIITVITPYNPSSPTDNVVFDLDGSTFAGPYTVGGNVWITTYYRSGIAYDLDDGCEWGEATDCFSFAYATGFRLNNCYPGTLVNCSVDGSAQTDELTATGFLITGNAQHAASLIGCKSGGVATGYKIDVTPPYNNTVTLTDCRSWANNDTDYYIARGGASLVNCFGESTATKIKIDDLATSVTFIGGDFKDMPAITYQSNTSPRPTFLGVRGQGNVIRGLGQSGGAVNTSAYATGPTLYLQDTSFASGFGGTLQFGSGWGAFAAIKGSANTGGGNTTGEIVFSTRRAEVDATLTESMRIGAGGAVTIKDELTSNSSSGITAAATTQAFIKASNFGPPHLGVYYGTGDPTSISAAKGSLYVKTDATSTTTRLWINHNGSTGWTAFTSLA